MIRLSLKGVIAVLGTTWAPYAVTQAGAELSIRPHAAGPSAIGTPTNCGDCNYCCSNPWSCSSHEVSGEGNFFRHECWPGECGAHPSCSPAFHEELKALWLAVATGRAADLPAELRKAKYAFYNEDRQAIQVLNCRGDRVIANSPLTPRQVAALGE